MGVPLLGKGYFHSLNFYEERNQYFKHLNVFRAVAIYHTRQYFRTSLFSLRNCKNTVQCQLLLDAHAEQYCSVAW